ncbi:MAG: hypothetical protein ABSG25_06350 [Bryobacteraceae bacterium]
MKNKSVTVKNFLSSNGLCTHFDEDTEIICDWCYFNKTYICFIGEKFRLQETKKLVMQIKLEKLNEII